MEEQLRDMKSCTFRPSINRSCINDNTQVIGVYIYSTRLHNAIIYQDLQTKEDFQEMVITLLGLVKVTCIFGELDKVKL